MSEAEAVATKVYERMRALNDALGEAARAGIVVNVEYAHEATTLGDAARRLIFTISCMLRLGDKR